MNSVKCTGLITRPVWQCTHAPLLYHSIPVWYYCSNLWRSFAYLWAQVILMEASLSHSPLLKISVFWTFLRTCTVYRYWSFYKTPNSNHRKVILLFGFANFVGGYFLFSNYSGWFQMAQWNSGSGSKLFRVFLWVSYPWARICYWITYLVRCPPVSGSVKSSPKVPCQPPEDEPGVRTVSSYNN